MLINLKCDIFKFSKWSNIILSSEFLNTQTSRSPWQHNGSSSMFTSINSCFLLKVNNYYSASLKHSFIPGHTYMFASGYTGMWGGSYGLNRYHSFYGKNARLGSIIALFSLSILDFWVSLILIRERQKGNKSSCFYGSFLLLSSWRHFVEYFSGQVCRFVVIILL